MEKRRAGGRALSFSTRTPFASTASLRRGQARVAGEHGLLLARAAAPARLAAPAARGFAAGEARFIEGTTQLFRHADLPPTPRGRSHPPLTEIFVVAANLEASCDACSAARPMRLLQSAWGTRPSRSAVPRLPGLPRTHGAPWRRPDAPPHARRPKPQICREARLAFRGVAWRARRPGSVARLPDGDVTFHSDSRSAWPGEVDQEGAVCTLALT